MSGTRALAKHTNSPHRPKASTSCAVWRRVGLTAALSSALMASSVGCTIAVPGADPVPMRTSAQQPGEGTTVPLQVIERGAATLAVVPVTINGEGPFPFILDTGASTSAVEASLADQLGLQPTGQSADVSGVTGTQMVQVVAVDDWAVGDTPLSAGTLGALDFPQPTSSSQEDAQIAGLLGSDRLSDFGSVTVDYDAEQLRFTTR